MGRNKREKSAAFEEHRATPSCRLGDLPSSSKTSRLNDLSLPHIESFNYALDKGLSLAVADIAPREIILSSGKIIQIWMEEVSVGTPLRSKTTNVSAASFSGSARLFPVECRELGLTYAAPLTATLCRRIRGIDGNEEGEVLRYHARLGDVPIMVRSQHCHLSGLSPAALVRAGEEATEFGGYFICNGIERIFRMLQIPKRNYPVAITRSAYTNRGPLYSNKGVVIRSVRPDQSSVTVTLHYLNDGNATVRFTVRKQEFFLPVILVLKALVSTTDREIYERVLAGDRENTYLSDRILMLLREAKVYGNAVMSRDAALAFLGSRFRGVIDGVSPSLSDVKVGQLLLDRFVLVHIPKNSTREKFDLLLMMLRKLYLFVAGNVIEDNADSLANHELLLSGHIILIFLKEKLIEFLQGIEGSVKREDVLGVRRSAETGAMHQDLDAVPKSIASRKTAVSVLDDVWFRKIVDQQPDVGRKLYYLLSTGNMISSTGLDLMQVSGYSVVADKLNFLRFTSHFRSVHRGQFFAEMKTTTVRKLLPENWGFLCPVHTPDGGPCGLLNHLASLATVVACPISEDNFISESQAINIDNNSVLVAPSEPPSFATSMVALLTALGMVPHAATGGVLLATQLPILLDGRLLGGASPHVAFRIMSALRRAKALATHVPAKIETAGQNVSSKQLDAISSVTRCVALGLTRQSHDIDEQEQEGDFPRSLEGLGSIGLVPPSLEVAFIPPPWWDSNVDPSITDPVLANERTLKLGMFGGSVNVETTSSESIKSATRLVGLFPGLFLSSAPQRPVRPILQLDTGLIEFVSPLEQPFMDIACTPEDVEDILRIPLNLHDMDVVNSVSKSQKASRKKGSIQDVKRLLYTHIELSAVAMLSELASLTPFSDMNQSPRNMYQCQMAKQTMGTPLHSWTRRADTKLFRLLTPQVPLVQNSMQGQLGLDEYPNGANACVAVISYTGYDMEDACIINKSSFERGFGWGNVYKTYEIDLMKDRPPTEKGRFAFHNKYLVGEEAVRSLPSSSTGIVFENKRSVQPGERIYESLDEDGLPPIGLHVREGDALYCYVDETTKSHRVVKHKDLEPAYVEEVRLLGPKTIGASSRSSGSDSLGPSSVSIKLRYDRRPVVGDKFSSRHGQKGVLSYLWPTEDMPFSAEGLSPDIIINPHAFPSRMTIGMLVESMAGKSGAMLGEFQSSTPFRFNENQRVVDYFGEQLAAAGYNHCGTETFYSGVTGEPLRCEIFFGIVYYQRLRHMVKDKAQVRSTGPINALTRQPVQGRKKGGGVRFGEMERDSLLAHGASFLLNDRLMNSSDRHIALVCKKCGSILAPLSFPAQSAIVSSLANTSVDASLTNASSSATTLLASGVRSSLGRRQPHCRLCGDGSQVKAVPLPYVFRYLACELAGMGVSLKLELSDE
jgi:DNA-directed RNA polymerase beta subunit